ncbi:MAG: Ig-like domain-containing protein [Clostridia bacterium]|nr:Ig-like domain-containing protein [Clostridia bacterium]
MKILRKYLAAKSNPSKRAIAFLALFLSFLVYSFSASISYAEDIPVTGITLNTSTLTMQASDTNQLTAAIVPADAANQNIIWASSDNSVAVVDEGLVTAFSQGSAIITASTEDGNYTASCEVTVTPLAAVSANSVIRVKLSMNNPSSVPFYLDGSYSIAESPSVSLPRQYYEVKLEDGQLNLYYGTKVLASGNTITLNQHSAGVGQNNFLWINNYLYGTRRYLGDMKFIINGTSVELINYIYLEEYLWGVVPHEMSNSFPSDALKAQAVAARTYAVRSMGGSNYDVLDTTASQVYKGYHPDNIESIAAVNATERIILQYDSNTVTPTYYSASNGGYTDIPYHIWGGGYDWPFYIKYDEYDLANPSSPYEEVFFPVAIDSEHPVTTSDNVTGTPNAANAILYFKTAILNSGYLQALGYNVSSVSDFELTGLINIQQHTYDSDLTEDHSRTPNIGVNNCVDFIMATAEFKVVAQKNGVAEETTVSGIELDMRYFDGANDDDTYRVFNMTALRLTIIEPRYENEILTGYSIYQRRYGHGVGMSQRGAQQRALNGQTYQQILAFYYPESGAALLNIEKPALTEISPLEDNSNATVICNDYLSVRAQASTTAERIFTLPPGARIEVVQPYYNSTFHMINFGDKYYYVHVDYVKIDDPVPVDGVSLSDSTLTLEIGETYSLTAAISPEKATDKSLLWTSDNESVVTVDAAGKVTAISGGNAVVTVTTHDGGYTSSCSIAVSRNVSGISVVPESRKIVVGESLQLTVEILPEDATNKGYTYVSENPGVASVDAAGLVTGHATGTAIITVTSDDGGYTAQCYIDVVKELITSDLYNVNRDKLLYENISIGTSAADIISSVTNTLGEVLVYDTEMNLVTEGNVSTGYYVQLVIDGEAADSLRIIIEGDCNPDAILDIIDYTLVRLHILNVSKLHDIYLESADVNNDGIIDIIDYTLIRLHILGVNGLYQQN